MTTPTCICDPATGIYNHTTDGCEGTVNTVTTTTPCVDCKVTTPCFISSDKTTIRCIPCGNTHTIKMTAHLYRKANPNRPVYDAYSAGAKGTDLYYR